jgi:hypothetical protein
MRVLPTAQRALAEYDRYGCVGLVVGPLKSPRRGE